MFVRLSTLLVMLDSLTPSCMTDPPRHAEFISASRTWWYFSAETLK